MSNSTINLLKEFCQTFPYSFDICLKTIFLQLFTGKDFHMGSFVSKSEAGSKENVNMFSAIPDGLSS